jgi:hypothetical protein
LRGVDEQAAERSALPTKTAVSFSIFRTFGSDWNFATSAAISSGVARRFLPVTESVTQPTKIIEVASPQRSTA